MFFHPKGDKTTYDFHNRKPGSLMVKSRSKLPKVEKRPVTVPRPFSFVIREQAKKAKKLEETQKPASK